MTIRSLSLALLLPFLLAAAALPARAADDPAGRWALHAGGKTLVVLDLKPRKDGGWAGTIERPTRMQITDKGFTEITGPVVHRAVRSGAATVEGHELIAVGVRPGDTDLYVFRVSPEGYAELGFKGFPMEPLLFVRAAADEKVAGSWAADRLYAQDRDYPSNAEMAAMFAADQAARANPGQIDWAKVAPEDARRRVETKTLLDSGRLRSGADYYHAAFVFQHGDQPDDFLMAHVLATIAVSRGRPDATWIAAATLDRYLQRIGRKQIFGTQYVTRDGTTTLEPYDRALVSDALRAAMGVPPQAEQEKRRAEIEAQMRATAPR